MQRKSLPDVFSLFLPHKLSFGTIFATNSKEVGIQRKKIKLALLFFARLLVSLLFNRGKVPRKQVPTKGRQYKYH